MTTLKQRIVHEALRQFSVKGFLNTSTTEIIEAVGTSKGGLYNHFKYKEELFYEALSQARKIWRERNLDGVANIERPIEKIQKILSNYRDHYLTDEKNLPGGCIFVNLAVELSDQRPHLAEAVSEGFNRLKRLFKRMIDQERERGGILLSDREAERVVELIFSSLLGACVLYTSDKSRRNLNLTINSMIDYLTRISTCAS